MTNFLLIRHGNSEAVKFVPGRMPEVHLSDSGREQVKNLATRISSFQIDLIFSSPLQRTMETAEAIASKIHKKIEALENLLEIDVGQWTGKTFLELEDDILWKKYHSLRSFTRIPSGESFLEVQKRMIFELDRLKNQHPNKSIAIVSHGDPIRSVVSYFLGVPVDFSSRIVIDTASLSMISISENSAKVQFINKWGFHLNELELSS
ncbi:MAG: histidine phosphatase family protein [Bacteroidota bacterium]|nr:histidine phosphatase family protein [Bacteroidota bacterium]